MRFLYSSMLPALLSALVVAIKLLFLPGLGQVAIS